MKKCCAASVINAFKFCPQCGGKLPEGPIEGLLVHFQKQTRQFELKAKFYQKRLATSSNKEFCQKEFGKCSRAHDKWASWTAALRGIIENIPKPD